MIRQREGTVTPLFDTIAFQAEKKERAGIAPRPFELELFWLGTPNKRSSPPAREILLEGQA